ncbi:hypothetical protein, partial [Microbispora triticiradicis]|uniref:hypothetical protein n=1 Tax=Microbispora triticiradicis TaxID=2200763 RepID=UPI001ABF141B
MGAAADPAPVFAGALPFRGAAGASCRALASARAGVAAGAAARPPAGDQDPKLGKRADQRVHERRAPGEKVL